jgi:hypothetical protein
MKAGLLTRSERFTGGGDWIGVSGTNRIPELLYYALMSKGPIEFSHGNRSLPSRTRCSMRAGWISLGISLLLAIGLSPSLAEEKLVLPDVQKAMDLLGFTADEKATIASGKTVVRQSPEESNELVVSLARVVPRPIDQLIEGVRSGKLLRAGLDVLAVGEIDTKKPLAESFKTAAYGADEGKEIDGLLATEPGSQFNLSDDEIKRFEKLKGQFGSGGCKNDPKCTAAVTTEYQAILTARMQAYMDGGLAKVAPYSRGKGKLATPGTELGTSLTQARVFSELFPATFKSVQAYPAGTPDSEDHYYWIRMKIQDRPTFILSHRRLFTGTGGVITFERQFYVGQSYNSLQILAGGVPDGAGTFLFYSNRTFTDQVAGAGQSMRHGIGRKFMVNAIVAHLDSLAKVK